MKGIESLKTEPDSVDSRTSIIGLGPWRLYFLVKLALFWKELIGFHAYENMAFAVFLLVPAKLPVWHRLKLVLSVVVSVALFYYDSWLPPIGRVLSQASLLASFDLTYFLELLGRFISWPVVAMLVVVWASYQLLIRWVRVGVIVMVALFALAVTQQPRAVPIAEGRAADVKQGGEGAGDEKNLDTALQSFYDGESRRSVAFSAPAVNAVPFDVIFVHVCSLSWDDIRAVGMDQHDLWQRFDLVLTHFNSVSSYSGPAAVRIMKANCGQLRHAALYDTSSANCYLMESLKRSGFETGLVMNHDGHFDDFLKLVQSQGRLTASPMPLSGVRIAQHAFDGAPIYDDMDVLSRWLDLRRSDGAPRAAVYYNTISLHDGNRLVGAQAKVASSATYRTRLVKLFDDLEQFMQQLESSGRRAVVVVIPEHGAALRGDKMQIPGMREIPSPTITEVPVGIRVVGAQVRRGAGALRVESSTSFLAVSHIIARMLEKSPFEGDGFAPSDYVKELPTTDFVAENDGLVVMRSQQRYYLRQGQGEWIDYAPSEP